MEHSKNMLVLDYNSRTDFEYCNPVHLNLRKIEPRVLINSCKKCINFKLFFCFQVSIFNKEKDQQYIQYFF